LSPSRGGSTFPATSKGKLGDSDRLGGQPPEWSDRIAGFGRQEGQPEVAGKLAAEGRSETERGSFGIVERSKTRQAERLAR